METMTLQFAAKILKSHGFDSGPRKIFSQCREVGLLPSSYITERPSHWSFNGHGGDYLRPMITLEGVVELERRLRAKARTTGGDVKVRTRRPHAQDADETSALPGVSVQEVDLGNGSECRLGF